MNSPYTAYIWASYGIVAGLLIALIIVSLRAYFRQRKLRAAADKDT